MRIMMNQTKLDSSQVITNQLHYENNGKMIPAGDSSIHHNQTVQYEFIIILD